MPWWPPTVEDRQGDQFSFFAHGAYAVPHRLPCGAQGDVADLGLYGGQYGLLPATAQDTVMADAHESLWQNMQCEAPDEFRIR